jgi:hypothetical protein
MKIEIDFSKPEEMRKMKRELEMALSTIETAIIAVGKNGHDPKQENLKAIVETPVKSYDSMIPLSVDENVPAQIFSEMPDKFLGKHLMLKSDLMKFPRSKMRRELNNWLKKGDIILVEQGKGRRSSQFRKHEKFVIAT